MKNKICSKCKTQKPLDDFGYNKATKDGYSSWCRKCCADSQRRWIANNREKFNKKCLGYYTKYRNSPKGKYWCLKNSARRQHREIAFTRDEFVAWFKKQKPVCHYCGAFLEMNKTGPMNMGHLTIDRRENSIHYTLDNIVLACGRCNWIKGAWFTEQEMLEIAQKYITPKIAGDK